MKTRNQAFTLIELLVVIAIIAILAAILFPVFARAKESAKKTMALTHCKQIGTASHLYATDHDDRFPSVYDGPNRGGNPEYTMQPYMKNRDMWYVNRENKRKYTLDATGDLNPGWADFGYNWGYEIRSASAMIDEEQCALPGVLVTACSGNRFNAGKTITSMDEPSRLFAFGDTYDTPRATIGGDGWQLDEYPGATRNRSLRYGGQLVMVMADSSAKSFPWKGGNWSSGVGGRASSPKSFEQRVFGYCANPDGNIRPFPRSGYPLGTMTCRNFVAIMEASGVTWWQD